MGCDEGRESLSVLVRVVDQGAAKLTECAVEVRQGDV